MITKRGHRHLRDHSRSRSGSASSSDSTSSRESGRYSKSRRHHHHCTNVGKSQSKKKSTERSKCGSTAIAPPRKDDKTNGVGVETSLSQPVSCTAMMTHPAYVGGLPIISVGNLHSQSIQYTGQFVFHHSSAVSQGTVNIGEVTNLPPPSVPPSQHPPSTLSSSSDPSAGAFAFAVGPAQSSTLVPQVNLATFPLATGTAQPVFPFMVDFSVPPPSFNMPPPTSSANMLPPQALPDFSVPPPNIGSAPVTGNLQLNSLVNCTVNVSTPSVQPQPVTPDQLLPGLQSNISLSPLVPVNNQMNQPQTPSQNTTVLPTAQVSGKNVTTTPSLCINGYSQKQVHPTVSHSALSQLMDTEPPKDSVYMPPTNINLINPTRSIASRKSGHHSSIRRSNTSCIQHLPGLTQFVS
ncbi:uncharacterized protein LOC143223370 [Tachypleus tridentatus]|uniref:uncharacterized protein LOC143223370 n=1 Tax=Tachypleus tridentatus TaxID=6853 RepID=UPI003FD55AA8